MMWVALPSLAEQWMVLQSSDPVLHQGRMLDGDKVLSIAPGVTVTLVSRSGRERVVSGPFDDRPDALLDTGSAAHRGRDTVPAVGATRGLGATKAMDSAPGRGQ